MNWYWVDLLIIGIIILSVITGLIRGFVKELIAVAVWALAIWLAYHYAHVLEPLLQNYLHDATANNIAAFVLIMIATLIAGGIVNALFSLLLKRSGLSGTDRLLGMVFGFIRGIFIVALLMVVIKMTALLKETELKKSTLYPAFTPIVQWLYGLMPEFIKQVKVLTPTDVVDFSSEINQG